MSVALLHRIISGTMEWAVILTPLMVYFFVLGLGVNGRKRPVAVRGTSNRVGLLLGLSGFLLVGPFSWIASVFGPADQRWFTAGFAVYLVLLVLVCLFLVGRQRRVLIIYNVHPAVFADVLHEVLLKTGITYTATPGRLAFADGQVVMDIDSVRFLNNVSLRWYGANDPVREVIERALVEELSQRPAGYLASDLMALAGLVLLVYIAFAGLLYYVGAVGVWEVLLWILEKFSK